jgi:hypothetical protein
VNEALLSIDEIKRVYRITAAWVDFGFPGDQPKLGRNGTCLVSSPFRKDEHPSLWIHEQGRKCRDLATDERYDVLDFVGRKLGTNLLDTRRRISERLGVASYRDNGAGEGPGKKGKWRVSGLRDGSSDELKTISNQRGFSIEALQHAQAHGFLRFRDWLGKAAWCVTDRRRKMFEFRRVDGELWPADQKGRRERKAHCYGRGKDFPIGITEVEGKEKCILVEGAPDFLASVHFLIVEGKEETVAPLAMLGAANEIINPEALKLLAGRRVRIFPQLDKAGQCAAFNWARALVQAGCRVDAFDLSGCLCTNGKAGKDLADLCKIDPDSWEQSEKFRDLLP